MVAHRPFIDIPIILHWLELSILLLDKEEGQSVGGYGWVDVALCQLLIDPVIECSIFSLRHGVDIASYGIRYSCFEVDSMVP